MKTASPLLPSKEAVRVEFQAMTAGAIIGFLFILFALALLIPGALATAGRLPGNSIVGLRVPEVRKDERTWKQAHRIVGPYLIFGGVALAFGAAFCFIADGWLWVAPAILAVVALVSCAVGGNMGARAARLIDDARATTDTAEPTPAPQVNLDALRNAAREADK